MEVGYLDCVLLKDGRIAAIMEVYSPTEFEADIGSCPEEWEYGPITLDMIERVIYHYEPSKEERTDYDEQTGTAL